MRALDFLRDRLACREEEFLALDENGLAREELIISFDGEVESLSQENHLLKDAVPKLEFDQPSRVFEVSALTKPRCGIGVPVYSIACTTLVH